METLKSLLAWCRRYVSIPGLAVIGAIVYMVFLQDNSIARIYSYSNTVDSLQAEIAVNRDSMELYRSLNHRLDIREPEIIERVVRENHNMNRPHEDVYIFN